LADGFVEHEAVPGLEPTKQGVKQMFRMYRASFPDLRMDVEEVLPSGDKVVGRIRATGTHTGEAFMGLPAAGKSVDVQLIDITRFDDDGLAREHWGVFDALSMMQQLGAIPATAPPS
jgi:predicted ester cyclase